MKYDDFKIFKFSTISKKLNRIRDNFSGIYKNIRPILGYVVDILIKIVEYIVSGIYRITQFIKHDFLKIYKRINFKAYNFSKIYRYFDIGRYNFSKIYRYFDIRRYNFSKIYRYFDIKRYKNVPIYFIGIVVFSTVVYLSIPTFFSYDKSKLENILCKDFNIKCSIRGKVGYSFFPTPRINIKDLIIQDFDDKKKIFAKIDKAVIKLSFYNLSNKNKLNFLKIELQKAEIDFDLHKLKEYKNFIKKKFNSRPINLKRGKINFFNDKKDVATMRDVNVKYKTSKNSNELILKGDFLNDHIYINLKNKKKDNDLSTIFVLKFLDINTKIDMFYSDLDKNTIEGNVSFRTGKNKITSIFDYKDGQIIFKQANLRNLFLDGKFDGKVNFLPYFNFNLNVDLNSLNFNSLHSSLIALDEENKKNLFKINEKINGQLNLSADKIFSKRALIDSFESRIIFSNGNIIIDQLLLNLGKLGAADVTGVIKNNKKFSNFNFENNIFVDNLKRFYNKFGIFNKQDISFNLFVSGNFDLVNLRLRLDEISDEKKFKDEDVAYIEKEFNELVLEDGYASLFNFVRLKEFVKLIVTETN